MDLARATRQPPRADIERAVGKPQDHRPRTVAGKICLGNSKAAHRPRACPSASLSRHDAEGGVPGPMAPGTDADTLSTQRSALLHTTCAHSPRPLRLLLRRQL